MPLFIRDDGVDALAARLQALTRARTKTDAVRLALDNEIRRQIGSLPPSRRLDKALSMVAAIRAEADAGGGCGGTFDMKAFSDEMWGG